MSFSRAIGPQAISILHMCDGSAARAVVFQPLPSPFELHLSFLRSLPLPSPLLGQVFFYPQIYEPPFPDATSANSPSL